MVWNGHPIRPLEFSSRIHPDLPVEVIDRSDLIQRLGRQYLSAPSRPAFYALHLVRSGRGVHTVDFERAPLKPGVLLRIRPGQIQKWDLDGNCEGTLVLSRLHASTWRETSRNERHIGISTVHP